MQPDPGQGGGIGKTFSLAMGTASGETVCVAMCRPSASDPGRFRTLPEALRAKRLNRSMLDALPLPTLDSFDEQLVTALSER